MEIFKVIIPVFTEEDRNLLSLTLESVFSSTFLEERVGIYIYSKKTFLAPPGTVMLVDSKLDILMVIRAASKFPKVVLCRPGVVFLDKGWVGILKTFIGRNRKSFIGGVCQSGDSKIRGYAFNKKLLTLSPLPLEGCASLKEGETELVRYVLATTGDNLKEVSSRFKDKGYDWDIQVAENSRCVLAPITIDVSKTNRKFNLRKNE